MSSVKVDYFTADLSKRVEILLGLPQFSFKNKIVWLTSASDFESGERLVTVHYNPDNLEKILLDHGKFTQSQVDNIANTRGVIVDLKTMKVIRRTFPRTASLPVICVPTDGTFLQIPTKEGYVTPKFGKYRQCFDGALIHSLNYNGVITLGTFKKIDASNSFFGDSKKFVEIFFDNQSVFSSLASLYSMCSPDIIHRFILNDMKLKVSSRDRVTDNKIVYLDSYSTINPENTFDLTSFILERNTSASKPIVICPDLSPEQVNDMLSGRNVMRIEAVDPSMICSSHNPLELFNDGERVIFLTEIGIYTLVPRSCAFRSNIMGGKVNIFKLFVDCIADSEHNTRGLIDIAFDPSSLHDVASKIINGEDIDLTQYRQIINNKQLMVLTNLIFIVPIGRIPECFDAYDEFENKIKEAIEYIIERKDDLQMHISEYGSLEGFEAMLSGVKFRDYLSSKIQNPNKCITGIKSHWAESAKELYNHFYAISSQSQNEQENEIAKECMGIVCLVSNSVGELLYSFITYKNKVEKERIAFSKRAAK